MNKEPEVTVADAIERLQLAIQPIIQDGFSISTIWKILVKLVQEAEIVYGAGRGADKHELVRGVWEELDNRYSIIQKLDAAIPMPWYLEVIDDKILRYSIDLLISLVVATLNETIWKKA